MEGMALISSRSNESVRILVTGALGYIGSVLVGELRRRGYDPIGLDTGFYDVESLFHDPGDHALILKRDVRDLDVSDLAGYYAIVHLAELSNDPLCTFNDDLTMDINHHGSVALAEKAKVAGVRRFIYASSCSIYGAGDGGRMVDETMDPVPLTAYARCKQLVERDVAAMANRNFAPVFLRNATAYGASPSMRFDIVLNNLCGLAWTERRIAMVSDGTPWRPLVHVRDICAAIACMLEAEPEAVSGERFNVGSDDQNYRIRDIADAVAREFAGCEVTFGRADRDNRSYRVSFAKIRNRFPNFFCA